MGMTTKTRLAQAAVALAVPIVLLVGVWVTGGLITNNFAVAMALTAAFMGLAALGCLFIAWRRRDLRVAVIGAYLVTAVVVGGYLGRSMLLDQEVNEDVVVAPPAAPASPQRDAATPAAPASPQGDAAPQPPQNELLSQGRFESVVHPATGTASVIKLARGGNVLTLTDFEVDNGPDLRVYLVAGPALDRGSVEEFEDLGALKGNKGDQQYDIPQGLDLDRYTTVVIWCRAFSVNFARAPLP